MRESYESPLAVRYAGMEMKSLFSEDSKFKSWRRLWLGLAEAEKELGLEISDEQIEELAQNLDNINYEDASEKEKILRHDVMAHIYAYGMQCPKARPIIHLGATSCYVGDNTDIYIMSEALKIVRGKVVAAATKIMDFANEHKALPCLGFTHFQPAQLTTVGKRATLWLQDLLTDLDDLEYVLSTLKPLGSKGTTGTQASFCELFEGDYSKAKELDKLTAQKMGFKAPVDVSGQTYSRKHDSRVLNVLSGIAQSASKFSNDMRLLQSLKELEEPFEKSQVGSSAMAYKRNPMRCERIASLCRYLIVDAQNAALTASAQWLERTLDDSANKRIAIPEAFLAADAILNLYINVASGIVVYPRMIERHIQEELPFMATENILMAAVKRGADRQEVHEKIRAHSMLAAENVKAKGGKNDLLERLAADPAFLMTQEDLSNELQPSNFIGFAVEQTESYVEVARARLEAEEYEDDVPPINV
ncbi:MAG: adenylosuccinate lyase [Clostridiales bacterium]|nr:adenylosuccinate lyase [Clostridiales bacterium]